MLFKRLLICQSLLMNCCHPGFLQMSRWILLTLRYVFFICMAKPLTSNTYRTLKFDRCSTMVLTCTAAHLLYVGESEHKILLSVRVSIKGTAWLTIWTANKTCLLLMKQERPTKLYFVWSNRTLLLTDCYTNYWASA